MQVKAAEIGPLSPRHRLRRLDKRTREARFLCATEQQLIAHLGGPDRVTPPQRFLIERVAADLLRLELFDEKIATGMPSEHDARVMHAMRNSVRLTLKALGLNGTPTKTPGQLLAEHNARLAQRAKEAV